MSETRMTTISVVKHFPAESKTKLKIIAAQMGLDLTKLIRHVLWIAAEGRIEIPPVGDEQKSGEPSHSDRPAAS